jgi:anti-sigma regulatory factor (Ser/Thr protein kinase)
VADTESVREEPPNAGVRAVRGLLSNAPPPDDKVHLGHWTLDNFAGLRPLRVSIRQALAEQPPLHSGAADDISERLTIVATELATNAIAHTRPPTVVQLSRTATTYIVEVRDNDPWLVPHFAEKRFTGGAGLGLHMARKLSVGMGWYIDDGRKYVWAQVAVSAAAST